VCALLGGGHPGPRLRITKLLINLRLYSSLDQRYPKKVFETSCTEKIPQSFVLDGEYSIYQEKELGLYPDLMPNLAVFFMK
jgi:hypothetical protein